MKKTNKKSEKAAKIIEIDLKYGYDPDAECKVWFGQKHGKESKVCFSLDNIFDLFQVYEGDEKEDGTILLRASKTRFEGAVLVRFAVEVWKPYQEEPDENPLEGRNFSACIAAPGTTDRMPDSEGEQTYWLVEATGFKPGNMKSGDLDRIHRCWVSVEGRAKTPFEEAIESFVSAPWNIRQVLGDMDKLGDKLSAAMESGRLEDLDPSEFIKEEGPVDRILATAEGLGEFLKLWKERHGLK